MNKDTKLTADDIKQLIVEESGFVDVPNIYIFGVNINLDSLKLTILSIFIWFFIWYFFGLFKLNKYSIIFFILLIIFEIFNLFSDPINLETNVNIYTFTNHRQHQRMQSILAILVLTFIFLYPLKINTEYKYKIYIIYIIIIFLLFISLIKYDTKNISRNITNITLFTEKMYNQSVILMIYIFYLIFIGISNETPK